MIFNEEERHHLKQMVNLYKATHAQNAPDDDRGTMVIMGLRKKLIGSEQQPETNPPGNEEEGGEKKN